MAKKFSGLVNQIQKNSFSEIASAQNEKKLKEVIILEELKAFIPPLTSEELQRLEESILQDGCRDELIAWERNPQEYILVDGHNRYSLCKKHNLPYAVLVRPFEDIDEVKDFMINNQLGKRNVTEEIKSYLRGIQYAKTKKKYGDFQRFDTSIQNEYLDKNNQNNASIQNEYLDKNNQNKTHLALAKIHKVSASTIQRDEKFAKNLDKFSGEDIELKWGILNRNIPISKTDLEKIMKFSDTEIETIKDNLLKTNQLILPNEKNISQKNNKKLNDDFKYLLKKLENALQKNQKEKAKEVLKEIENKLN